MNPKIVLTPTKDYGHSYVDKNYVNSVNVIIVVQQLIGALFFTLLGIYLADKTKIDSLIIWIVGIIFGLLIIFQVYKCWKMPTLVSAKMTDEE